MLRILDDIAAAVCNSRSSVIDTPLQASRQYNSRNEFNELVQRVMRKDAEVVLRKVFLCRESCNVMQEIWIKDPENPEATSDPLKSYSIVHSHLMSDILRIDPGRAHLQSRRRAWRVRTSLVSPRWIHLESNRYF